MIKSIHQQIIESLVGEPVQDLKLCCQYDNFDGGTFIYLFSIKKGMFTKEWHVARIIGNEPDGVISQPPLKSKTAAEEAAKNWCELAKEQEDALDEMPPKVLKPEDSVE